MKIKKPTSNTHELADVLIKLGEIGQQLKQLESFDLHKIAQLLQGSPAQQSLREMNKHRQIIERKYHELLKTEEAREIGVKPVPTMSRLDKKGVLLLKRILGNERILPTRTQMTEFANRTFGLNRNPKDRHSRAKIIDRIVNEILQNEASRERANSFLRELAAVEGDRFNKNLNELDKVGDENLIKWFRVIEKL